jgi:hypothetical protein
MNFLKATDGLSLPPLKFFNLSLDLELLAQNLMGFGAICGHDGLLKVRWCYSPPSAQEK